MERTTIPRRTGQDTAGDQVGRSGGDSPCMAPDRAGRTTPAGHCAGAQFGWAFGGARVDRAPPAAQHRRFDTNDPRGLTAMPRMPITTETLQAMPREDDIVGFATMALRPQQVMALRTRARNGRQSTLLFNAEGARLLRDFLAHAAQKAGPAAAPANLEEMRPTIQAADLDGMADGESTRVQQVEVRASPEDAYLLFLLDRAKQLYRVLHLDTPIAQALCREVDQHIQSGVLSFFSDPPSRTTPRN